MLYVIFWPNRIKTRLLRIATTVGFERNVWLWLKRNILKEQRQNIIITKFEMCYHFDLKNIVKISIHRETIKSYHEPLHNVIKIIMNILTIYISLLSIIFWPHIIKNVSTSGWSRCKDLSGVSDFDFKNSMKQRMVES